jgi:CheY-like chemotaxis protein
VSRAKILLVEDDLNLGFVVKDNLEMEGFAVTLYDDGEKGWLGFMEGAFDLCILDVMLPRKDGFELARAIRQRNEAVPILFLTAKSMKEDRIAGFKTGADDYLTKPFSIEELVLRIEVFLRRSGHGQSAAHLFPLGDLVLDYQNLLLRGKAVPWALPSGRPTCSNSSAPTATRCCAAKTSCGASGGTTITSWAAASTCSFPASASTSAKIPASRSRTCTGWVSGWR